MQLRAEEISQIIKQQIASYDKAVDVMETGTILSVGDGIALLQELGALRGRKELTEVGRALAALPVDPRLGRMLVEANRTGCLREVLVVAAALSVQDPRERPTEQRSTADEKHAR